MLKPPPGDADGSGARRGADAHDAVAMAREEAEQYGGAAPGAPLEARQGVRRAGHRRAREHAVRLSSLRLRRASAYGRGVTKARLTDVARTAQPSLRLSGEPLTYQSSANNKHSERSGTTRGNDARGHLCEDESCPSAPPHVPAVGTPPQTEPSPRTWAMQKRKEYITQCATASRTVGRLSRRSCGWSDEHGSGGGGDDTSRGHAPSPRERVY